MNNDNILYKEDKEKADAWVKKYFDSMWDFWISIFWALKDACKRSRQNITTLTKDLFWALMGKKKNNGSK